MRLRYKERIKDKREDYSRNEKWGMKVRYMMEAGRGVTLIKSPQIKRSGVGTSVVVWYLGIHLPMQGMQVHAWSGN